MTIASKPKFHRQNVQFIGAATFMKQQHKISDFLCFSLCGTKQFHYSNVWCLTNSGSNAEKVNKN